MKQYLDMIQHVLTNGERRKNRTGVDTIATFGHQVRYDLRYGFPLLTTKRVNFSAVVRELLWFLSGSTNIKDLQSSIWNEWADENGDLGPIYGSQWRSWGGRGIDQIQQAISTIKTNPDSRRIIVSAWNVEDIPAMRLPPCHLMFQFNVSGRNLDLHLYQRSADLALGVPFNIASYALLLSMVANECHLTARHFVHTFGDLHIYENHLDGLREQQNREPRQKPTLALIKGRPVLDMREDDIDLYYYDPHPAIRFEVAV